MKFIFFALLICTFALNFHFVNAAPRALTVEEAKNFNEPFVGTYYEATDSFVRSGIETKRINIKVENVNGNDYFFFNDAPTPSFGHKADGSRIDGGSVVRNAYNSDLSAAGGRAGGGAIDPRAGGGTIEPCVNMFGPVDCDGPTDDDLLRQEQAARNAISNTITINNPLKANSITEFLMDIIRIILIIATPLIVLMIIFAGFMYVMAQGKPDKISQANKALLFALIGGLLILGAFVILKIIEGTVAAFMS